MNYADDESFYTYNNDKNVSDLRFSVDQFARERCI